MLTDFYTAFSALCFTLLGLWLVVVQSRLSEWQASPAHRRRAYGVALHFSLPGMMGLLALIDPDSKTLWRTAFAVVAIGGAVVLFAVRGPAPDRLSLAAFLAAPVLYLLVGVIAVFPQIVSGIGIVVAAERVEAFLLSVLVFLGVNIAWLMLFAPLAGNSPSRQG